MVKDHHGLAYRRTLPESRLCMAAPRAQESRELVITFEDLHAQGQAMGPCPAVTQGSWAKARGS
jgi:hypothetical protein